MLLGGIIGDDQGDVSDSGRLGGWVGGSTVGIFLTRMLWSVNPRGVSLDIGVAKCEKHNVGELVKVFHVAVDAT